MDEAEDRASMTSARTKSSSEAQRTARARERRFLWWFIALVLGSLVVSLGVSVLVVSADSPADRGSSSSELWLVAAILGGGVLLVVGVAMAFALWRRRRGSALFARSPLWELPTQRQRRLLVRALRRGDPIASEQRDLALRTARDTSRRGGLVWLYVAIGALQLANVFLQDGWGRWFYLASGMAFLGLAVVFAWQVRRMRVSAQRLEDGASG